MHRYFPIRAALVTITVAAGWPVLRHRRRYASWGIARFGRANWRDHVPELAFAALAVSLFGETVAWAPWPSALTSLAVAPPHPVIGSMLAAFGLAVVVSAQAGLGASWRIGIDETAHPGLVVDGLYRISRNPIFAGMVIALTGLTFLMTTPITLFILAGGFLAVRSQVMLEEKYLARTYGDAYSSYAQRVGRFLPWIGRLR